MTADDHIAALVRALKDCDPLDFDNTHREWARISIATALATSPAFRALVAGERVAALREAAQELREYAAQEFELKGPHDPRGSAIWDSASHIAERADQETP